MGVPAWTVNSGSYLYSMNAVIEVDISGQTPTHASNVLGIFSGNECRGVAYPVQFGSRRLYFMDIYSNRAQLDSMYFRYYDADVDFVYRDPRPFVFSRNTVQGSVANPWHGAFALWNDYPLSIKPVVDQIVLKGVSFPILNVLDSVDQIDSDRIIWSAQADYGLDAFVQEDSGILVVTPFSPTWSGTGMVRVTATETGVVGHTYTVAIRYTVRPYNAIAFAPLPWQEIDTSEQFVPLDLAAYSTPADTCRRYYVRQLPVRGASSSPGWVAPVPGAGAMSVTAFVEYDGLELGSPTSQLAAFIGGQLRGVTTPTFVLGRYWFFLNIENGAPGTIEFRYYDPINRHIYEIPSGTNFVSSGTLGSLSTPHVISPMLPLQVQLSAAGRVQVAIRDSTWRGTQKMEVIGVDCGYGTDNRDTALLAYRVWDDPSGFPYFESADSVTFVEGACRALYQASAYDFIDEFRLRYAIIGGADAAAFQIAEHTGNLTWVIPPDYEMPSDQNADNLFEVLLEVRDLSDFRDTLALRVYVLDKVTEGLSAHIWNSGFLCGPGKQAELRASGGPTFTWSTGSTLDTIYVTQPGTYRLTVSDAETGCSVQTSTQVEYPSLNIQPATATIFQDSVVLGGQIPTGGVFSGTGVTNGKIYPPISGGGKYAITYTLLDSLGCTEVLRDTLPVFPFSGDLGYCGCAEVRVSLDSSGTYMLQPRDVLTCEGGLLIVDDINPLNQSQIDCPGTWPYAVLDAAGNLTCRGKVTAVDITGPAVAEIWGRSSRPIAGSSTNGLPGQSFQRVNLSNLIWRDTFICPDISAILQNPQSWSSSVPGSLTHPYYAGGVRFVDGSARPGTCDCQTTTTVTDQVVFYPCSQINNRRIWAKITRLHQGRDCFGNIQSVTQEIYLFRPELTVNQIPEKELILNGQSCGGATREEMLAAFRKTYYVYNNPTTSTPRKYALFPEALNSSGGSADELLDKAYSLQTRVMGAATLCNGSLHLEVQVLLQDDCQAALRVLDTVALYWMDQSAPIFDTIASPAVLKASPVSGKAVFRSDLEGLGVFFGLGIRDNCALSDFSVETWSCTDSLVHGIAVAGSTWRPVNYPTVQDGGQRFITGVPVGRHLLRITARDLCGNQNSISFPFSVVDASAPIVKARDTLSLTLSDGGGSPYGRLSVADLDVSSSDPQGLAWKRLRRVFNPLAEAAFLAAGYDSDGDGRITVADGKDWNQDGYIGDNPLTPQIEVMERFEYSSTHPDRLMTPALDYVEWFCADLDGVQMVELWVMDTYSRLDVGCSTPGFAGHPAVSGGNLSYATSYVRVQDLITPEYALPQSGALIACTAGALVDSLNQTRLLAIDSPAYHFLENNIFKAQGLSGFTLLKGAGCRSSQVDVQVKPALHCQSGAVALAYTVHIPGQTPQKLGEIQVLVQAIHAYTLRFPADVQLYCSSPPDTANVADGGELGCDALAVYVSDKRYQALSADHCYTIHRTFTVVNWCQYDEACGEPSTWAVEIPRDPGANGANGVNLLVRDTDGDGSEEIYYEDQPGTLLWNGVQYNGGPGLVSADDVIPNLSSQPLCPNAGGERFAWTYTQYINVRDDVAPVVDEAATRVFPLDESTCSAGVHLTVTARDACFGQAAPDTSLALQLEYARLRREGEEASSVLLEANPERPNQWQLHGTYPEGTYTLLVRVRDGCGNISAERAVPFRVADTGVSAPVCKNGLSLTLSQGSAALVPDARIWATDVKGSDIFDCNGQVQDASGRRIIRPEAYFLVKDANADGRFGFADGLDTSGIPIQPSVSVAFDCRDMQGDTTRWLRLRLYARDGAGNWSWCETYVSLRAAEGQCAAVNPSFSQIGGRIQTLSGEKLEGVELSLSGGMNLSGETDSTGHFRFFGLNQGAAYTVTPFLDRQAQNGVSTIDLIQVTQHILGRKILDSPYRLIAADVNNSGSITTMDIIQMRRLILNLTERFPGNPSWRFVDASFSFKHPENPWKDAFPESVRIDSLSQEIPQVGFIAVKTGDVNGNARGDLRTQESSHSGADLVLETDAWSMQPGERYSVEIRGDLHGVEGFQFTLQADRSAIAIESVEPLTMSERHLGVFAEDGFVTGSWDAVGSQELAESGVIPLFRLSIRALKTLKLAEAMTLNSRLTPAESYTANGVAGGVRLVYISPSVPAPSALYLAQNQPNPFREDTHIAFSLPEAGEAMLQVHDVLGRLVWSHQGWYSGGNQELVLRSRQLGWPGVYFYTLQYGSKQLTRCLLLE